MADLQKYLSSAAQVSERPVAQPTSAPGDVVRAIGAVGKVIQDEGARKEGEKLEENLNQLGREAFAAKVGGPLKEVTSRFEDLKEAQRQGILTETFLQIEAEKVLKESINRYPGYKDQLRKKAYEITGFDPTGAQTQALYAALKPTKGSTRQSFAEKMLEEAQFIADNTGEDVQVIMKQQAKAAQLKMQAEITAQQAALGSFSSREVFNTTLQEAEPLITDLFRSVVTEVNAGGVKSPEQRVAQVQAGIQGHKNMLRERLNMSGVKFSATEWSDWSRAIDNQWAAVADLAASGSMDKILSRQANSISNAMTIEGLKTMGTLAMLNKVGGQEAVKNYYTYLDKYSRPDELELLKSTDPLLAQHLNSVAALTAAASRAYENVMGIPNSYPGQAPEQPRTPVPPLLLTISKAKR